MAQDNGNITAYCQHYNHENIIVNIPALTEAILGGAQELTEDEEKIRVTIASVEDGVTSVNIEQPRAVATPAEQPASLPTDRVHPAKAKKGPKS
jgi:hypothetical protein